MSALARWDAFLTQIQQRHHEVVAGAEAASRHFIAKVAAAGDHLPLSHELMGVASRLLDLESKIIDTWHAQVEDAIFADGHDVAVRDHAYRRGLVCQRALADRREELEPRVLAELARQRYAHGDHAGAIAIGAHPISQEAAVNEWREMRAAEHRLHDLRPPRPLEAVIDSERAQIAYWRAYLTMRGQLEPVLARDLAMEIRSRMAAWYMSHAEYEETWVAAGRPRLPI